MADSVPPLVECEQLHACLAVEDIATAVDFYPKKLGFANGFTWGDPPTLAGGESRQGTDVSSQGHARNDGLRGVFPGRGSG
jgi:catechol 2,3-dioxygenase-like lactoylglutathione lyase family enzyme